MVFGTAMVGMPKELWSAQAEDEEPIVPYESLTADEWNEMIQTWVNWSAQFPGVILFPFEPIPGSEAYAQLEALGLLNYVDGTENTDDTLRPLQEDPVIGIAARKALAELQEQVFSKEMTKTRMSHADYALKARIFMEIFNRGSRMAFGNRMQ
jgi:hypothetical protein